MGMTNHIIPYIIEDLCGFGVSKAIVKWLHNYSGEGDFTKWDSFVKTKLRI